MIAKSAKRLIPVDDFEVPSLAGAGLRAIVPPGGFASRGDVGVQAGADAPLARLPSARRRYPPAP